MIQLRSLTPRVGAEIGGVEVAKPIDDGTWVEIRAAFEEYSVLLFHGTALDDETQIAFSRRFGTLEVTRSMNPAAGTPFARRSVATSGARAI